MLGKVCALGNKCGPCLAKFDWFPALLTRVVVGWVFLEAGWGKINNLSKVVEFFAGLGIPAPQLQAPFVAGLEFIGGILLIIGLATRVISVPLIITMVVAIITAKRDDVNAFSDLFTMSEFLYIPLLIWLIFFGAGKISVDNYLCRGKSGI